MYQKWNLFDLLDPALLGPAVIGAFGAALPEGALVG